jgi:hypothetical protein
LTAGGNAAMTNWLDNVAGLLHAWYPGQEGGTAIGEILFGDVNPLGKLPASFEKRWEDSANANSYYDPDNDKRVAYAEGIFMGYRHFDSMCLASKTRQAIAARVSASMASRKTRERRRRGTLACRLCEPHRFIERPTTG